MSTPLVDLLGCKDIKDYDKTEDSPCNLLHTTTPLPVNDFDGDTTRYYYDGTTIMARIHLRSDTLFPNVDPNGQLDCQSINRCFNPTDDKHTFDCRCFLDAVPCTNNRQALYGTYVRSKDSTCNFQNSLFGAVCCNYGTECTGIACAPYWWDVVNNQCRIGDNVHARCPDNQCVYNQTESVCNCCDGGPLACYTHHNSDWHYYSSGTCFTKYINNSFPDQCLTKTANHASLVDPSNPGSGIATVEYFQDISTLSSVGGTVNLSTTAQWRKDLFHGQCKAFPTPKSLPAAFALPLFTMSFMLCIVHVFYYESYGLVEVGNNTFYNTCPYLDGTPEILDYLRVLVQALAAYSGMDTDVPYWKDSGFQTPEWWTVSNALCRLPVLSQDKDNNNIVSMTMPFSLYESQVKNASDENEAGKNLTRLVSSLLDEASSTVSDFTQGTSTPVSTCTLVYVPEDDLSCLYIRPTEATLDQKTAPRVYLGTTKTMPAGAFLLTVVVKARVQAWSPLLYAYARILQPALPVSDAVVQTLAKSSRLVPLVPSWQALYCPNNDRSEKALASCFQDLCRYVLTPSSAIASSASTLTGLFVNAGSECACLRSNLQPLSESQYDNHVGMCFNTRCTADPLTLYNLDISETECRQACPTMDSWIYATGSKKLNNLGQLDSNRFDQLCQGVLGVRAFPLNGYWVVASFLLFFFGCFYFSYQFRSPRTTTTGAWITTSTKRHVAFSVSLVGFTAVSVFLGFLLYGDSLCDTDNKKSLCDSRLTGTRLPPEFCTQAFSCDCVFNEDCPANFRCQSGVCFPNDPNQKPTSIQTTREIHGLGLTLGLLVLVMIMTSVCTLRVHNRNAHRYWILSIFLVLVGVWIACFFTLWSTTRIKTDYTTQ